MLRVGLTGGIGSGKSAVARRLESHGAVIVDADQIAREVVEPGTPGFEAVVAEFGPDVVAADGSLDRAALGRIVFADDVRRQALNAIVHPLVYRRRSEVVGQAPEGSVVVEDIPLLVENGLGAGFPLVLVVHAPAEERVRRLVGSRGMAPNDAWARLRAQASDEERRAAADVWLDNSGSVDRLEMGVDALWSERLVPFEANLRAGQPAPRSAEPVIADPDPTWPEQAARLVARVARVGGGRAVRVDHIGSTAVAGLAAKDVLDVQVVVDDLSTADRLASDLGDAGLVRMPGEWHDRARDGAEVAKVVTCNADPGRAANVHVREMGSPAWRDALLLRDFLRATPSAVAGYADLKRELARQPHESVDAYADAKTPWISAALSHADDWAEQTGWSP